jgi:hypothetical protein
MGGAGGLGLSSSPEKNPASHGGVGGVVVAAGSSTLYRFFI